MIRLSKLDQSPVLVSLETIKYMESTPDTVIFFVNGESMLVREPLEQVEERVIEYKAKVLKKSTDSQ